MIAISMLVLTLFSNRIFLRIMFSCSNFILLIANNQISLKLQYLPNYLTGIIMTASLFVCLANNFYSKQLVFLCLFNLQAAY